MISMRLWAEIKFILMQRYCCKKSNSNACAPHRRCKDNVRSTGAAQKWRSRPYWRRQGADERLRLGVPFGDQNVTGLSVEVLSARSYKRGGMSDV